MNEYHGVQVRDEFQWLENAEDPAVLLWTDGQNKRARAVLDKLSTRPWIRDRLERLFAQRSTNYFALSARRGQLFLLKQPTPTEQPILVTLGSITNLSSEHVILDPSELNTSGSTAIDWYVPSPDGKVVAVSLSENGGTEGALYFYETSTSQRLPDIIPTVHQATAGGSAAWNADGTGIFYTRYPHRGERPDPELKMHQQVYFHKLGTPAEQDRSELEGELPRIAKIQLQRSPDGRHILASIANGNGLERSHFLRDPSGRWQQIARFDDQIAVARFGHDPLYIEAGKDNALYLLSLADAPSGKILRLPLANPELGMAKTVLTESTNVIQTFETTASGLALVLAESGSTDFAFVDFLDKAIRKPADRNNSAIQELVSGQADELFYRDESFTEPSAWWRYNQSRDRERAEPTPLTAKSSADFGDIETVQEKVPSSGGTKIPLSIIRKKGTRLNGENPTILTCDGNLGTTAGPRFDVSRRVWFDQGGVIAVANLRGETSLHKRPILQNLFDDFLACAEFLVHSNYTKRSKLAVQGANIAGGLEGAFLAQRPDLARAVISPAGTYDLLRAELDAEGSYNVPLFGSVTDPNQFRSLYACSPFHNVQDGISYPAILMLANEHSLQGSAAHVRKMVARLQSATTSKDPVLFSTGPHPTSTPASVLAERIEQLADTYAFLFDQLGIDYSLVDRGPWSGSVTPTSAVVKAKLGHEGIKARLVLSKSPLLTRRTYSDPIMSRSNQYDLVEFRLSDLKPDTSYHYALELNGRLERTKRGEFRTFPEPGPASFTFAFASCARTGSPSDVFDRIRDLRPLFYMNMGDFHYLDIQTNSRPRFRAAYDSVLASPQQSDLYRHVPFVYMWDDHDFGGNNSDRRTIHDAVRLTYEEFVPHYPLAFPLDGPICQSFSVGRVKFILTDLRSARDAVTNRDDATKSMMGATQKEWFKKELLEANGRFPLICWVSTVPWIGLAGTNVYRAVRTNEFGFIHHTNLVGRTNTESFGSRTNAGRALPGRGRGGPRADEDHWSVFATERREIADFIKTNHISGVCILHGDSHMLAADDGSNSDYATGGGAPIPVMCAGPLDQEPSLKGGPYSQGVYKIRKGESGFGLLTVDDRGDRIDVYYSGRNNQNEEKVSLNFSVPAINGPLATLVRRPMQPASDRRRLRTGL